MTSFIFILLAAFSVAFIVVRAYRLVGNWKVSGSSLVSFSPGKGQNQRKQQTGFVHPGAAVVRRRVPVYGGAVRKPWGW